MMKSWREVAKPHADVLAGTFVQSDFSADITQVVNGSGPDGYAKVAESDAAGTSCLGIDILRNGQARRGIGSTGGNGGAGGTGNGTGGTSLPLQTAAKKKFLGEVRIDASSGMSKIAEIVDEVVSRLSGIGANVKVTLTVEAKSVNPFAQNVVRTVSTNATTLSFARAEFS